MARTPQAIARALLATVGAVGAGLIAAPAAGAFDTGPHSDITRDALAAEGFNGRAIRVAQVDNWFDDLYDNAEAIRSRATPARSRSCSAAPRSTARTGTTTSSTPHCTATSTRPGAASRTRSSSTPSGTGCAAAPARSRARRGTPATPSCS